MTIKTYNQNCGLAAALDVVGDRWTPLIIRALLAGPARFGEIRSQLPGIGTNLLSDRLGMLSRRGVVVKRGGQQGEYALTERGEALRPAVQGLARWGRQFLPVPGGASDFRWAMFNIESAFRPERAEGIEAVVEFRSGLGSGFGPGLGSGLGSGEKAFHLVIRRGHCRAVSGPAVSPDVTLRSDGEELLGAGARLQIHGDGEVFDRIRPCFDL